RLTRLRIVADRGDQAHLPAEPAHGQRLVRTLAAGHPGELGGGDGLARLGSARHARHQIEVHAADDDDLHAATLSRAFAGYGRDVFTTRPELSGTFGMVASTHWLATAAGMAVLEAGGTAFDAAAAAGFTLHVVEPHLNGPGGEVPAIFAAASDR